MAGEKMSAASVGIFGRVRRDRMVAAACRPVTRARAVGSGAEVMALEMKERIMTGGSECKLARGREVRG